MNKYLIIIKDLGRKKVNMTFNGILEDDVIDVMLNFCKKHLMSDGIYFMENGDIVAGWRTVGKFKLEKQFN